MTGVPRTALTAVAATGERVDVVVEAEPTDLVSGLEAALAGLLPPTPPGLWLGNRRLAGDSTLAEAGIRAGVVVGLGGPLPDLADPDRGAVRLEVVGGAGAGGPAPVAAVRLEATPAGVVAIPTGGEVRRDGAVLTGPTALGPEDVLAVGEHLLALGRPMVVADARADGLSLVVNRAPRLTTHPQLTSVRRPALPPPVEPRTLQVLPLLLPLALGAVMAVVAGPVFLLFTLLSPLLALGSWASERRSCRAANRRAISAHAAALAEADGRAAEAAREEARSRRRAAPDPAAVLAAATGPGRRLWERRRGDPEALLLRVGTGRLPATAVRWDTPPGTEPLAPPVLHDVPVCVDLRAAGVLGVTGPRAQRLSVARWLVGQAAALHSPEDLRVVVLAAPEVPPGDWHWARWLPHATGPDGWPSPDGLAQLRELLAGRDAGADRADGPDVLVVLDGARTLRTQPGVTRLLRDGPALGLHAVCLDEQEQALPGECRAVVTLDGAVRLALAVDGAAPHRDVRADLVDADWAGRLGRSLAPLRAGGQERAARAVPASVRLLDVLGLDPPTPEAVLERWAVSPRSTTVVLGVGAEGPYAVDLRRDGPHALVAGTTGAGKSELLQTLVSALAVANRPDALSFVLVDYKGGAAFAACAGLPHVAGVVTDLDGHLAERALASLTAELTNRERLLAAAGAKDVEDYWAAAASSGPLARLVIVVDEFVALAEELPDFVRGLVGIAQRGRSLGLHLVLATQRPGGVVSPEIRANTALRIALRMTDRSESLDVVDAPDAALLDARTPGRACVRTGHAGLSLLQTARVGGRRPEAGPPPARVVRALVGPCPARAEPTGDGGRTDLDDLVAAVRAAAAALGVPPARRPWLPALPDRLDPADLPEPEGLVLGYGLEDVPAEQSVRLAGLDLERGGSLLVAGAPRSGRTTLLRALAAAVSRHDPDDVHLYALECGHGGLAPLTGLPHCGAVVTRAERDRADRLLTRLLLEVTRRQDLLAGRGLADLGALRAAGERLPYLLLLVDSWEGFQAAFDELDHDRLSDLLLRLLREGAAAGLRIVMTGDRGLLLGRPAATVEDVLVLRLADRGDYALAGLSAKAVSDHVPAGRGFRSATGTEVQVALVASVPAGTRAGTGCRPFRVDPLPPRVTHAEATALTPEPLGPLQAVAGVGGDELTGVVVDLQAHGPGFTVVGAPRSGRSTALLALACGLARGGARLVVLTPRPSPLRALAGAVVLQGPDPDPVALAELLADPGPTAVLVDDAELLASTAVADRLGQVLRVGRDQGHAVLVAATPDDLAQAFRGVLADVRRSRSGLLLTPESHLHGDLLGVRLPRSAACSGPPGRALLVTSGTVQQVQVPCG